MPMRVGNPAPSDGPKPAVWHLFAVPLPGDY